MGLSCAYEAASLDYTLRGVGTAPSAWAVGTTSASELVDAGYARQTATFGEQTNGQAFNIGIAMSTSLRARPAVIARDFRCW